MAIGTLRVPTVEAPTREFNDSNIFNQIVGNRSTSSLGNVLGGISQGIQLGNQINQIIEPLTPNGQRRQQAEQAQIARQAKTQQLQLERLERQQEFEQVNAEILAKKQKLELDNQIQLLENENLQIEATQRLHDDFALVGNDPFSIRKVIERNSQLITSSPQARQLALGKLDGLIINSDVGAQDRQQLIEQRDILSGRKIRNQAQQTQNARIKASGLDEQTLFDNIQSLSQRNNGAQVVEQGGRLVALDPSGAELESLSVGDLRNSSRLRGAMGQLGVGATPADVGGAAQPITREDQRVGGNLASSVRDRLNLGAQQAVTRPQPEAPALPQQQGAQAQVQQILTSASPSEVANFIKQQTKDKALQRQAARDVASRRFPGDSKAANDFVKRVFENL